MKKLNYAYRLISLALIFLLLLPATRIQAQDNSQEVFVSIKVDGLSCPFCAYGLEKKLKKIDGAKEVFIDLEAGEATFRIDREKKPTEEKLQKIVKDAGFVPRKITFSEIKRKKEDEH